MGEEKMYVRMYNIRMHKYRWHTMDGARVYMSATHAACVCAENEPLRSDVVCALHSYDVDP